MSYHWLTTAPSGKSHTHGADDGQTGWRLHAVRADDKETLEQLKGRPAICGLVPRVGWGIDFAPGELEKIAAYLGRTVANVLSLFWASPGAVVRSAFSGEVRLVPTITPRIRQGRCVFLDDRDRCRIHAVAPFGCAYADTHMPEEEWRRRAMIFYRVVEEDSEYQSLRRTLAPAKSWKPRG